MPQDRRIIFNNLKTLTYPNSEVLTYRVEIEVGDRSLDALALKAAGNKSRQARRGPLIVVVTNCEPRR